MPSNSPYPTLELTTPTYRPGLESTFTMEVPTSPGEYVLTIMPDFELKLTPPTKNYYPEAMFDLGVIGRQAAKVSHDPEKLHDNAQQFSDVYTSTVNPAFERSLAKKTSMTEYREAIADHIASVYELTSKTRESYSLLDYEEGLALPGLIAVGRDMTNRVLTGSWVMLDALTTAKALDMALRFSPYGSNLADLHRSFSQNFQFATEIAEWRGRPDRRALEIMLETMKTPQYAGMTFIAEWERNGLISDPPQQILAKGEGRAFVETHALAQGLDESEAKKVVDAWSTIRGPENVDGTINTRQGWHYIAKNIETLGALHENRPGIASRLLAERKIKHFGRWPVSLLLSQFDDNPEGSDLFTVGFAESDHNGAYYQTGQTLYGARRLWPQIKVFEAGSKGELARGLISIRNQFGEAATSYLGGHGDTASLRLGKNIEITMADVDDTRSIHRDARKKGRKNRPDKNVIHPEGKQVLVSCSTGVEDGFAERVANASGRATEAPRVPDNGQFVEQDGRLGFKFYKNQVSTYLPGRRVEKILNGAKITKTYLDKIPAQTSN